MPISADTRENVLWVKYPDAFEKLLIDHTTHKNIFWATNDYEEEGEGYHYDDEITIERVIGDHGELIVPRALKRQDIQDQRVKDMAEVFTPSGVCNVQNNLVDEIWFGRKDVFNTTSILPDGTYTWKTNSDPITEFPKGKTWKDYIRDRRLELTCGEGPYLASRYDTTTGELIPLADRIGIIDRKLRLVSENCHETGEWLNMAQEAYKNTYGFEWQGDNLLLAREALLTSFVEYYEAKFGKAPLAKSIEYIAYIVSWNLWQMDGLKMVVPNSCDKVYEDTLFDGKKKVQCEACAKGKRTGHIGINCYIRDWRKPKDKQKVQFSTLLH